jgi:hypothetical protein
MVPGAAIIDNYSRALIHRLLLRPTAETLTGLLLAACPRGMGMGEVEMVGWGMWNA